MKAPIIVLEGLDACGKSTQMELLLKNLEDRKISVGWKRFPGYEITPAGARIAAYLRGEFGDFHNLDPKMIAGLYAADRLSQIREVEKMREKHEVVIFDRGVTSNLIYTAARGKNDKERDELFSYIEKLEYEIYGFPKESLVLFLDASDEARAKIHEAKNRPGDVHEVDTAYLQKVRKNALKKCDEDFRWTRINVDCSGELRRREDVAKEILNHALEKLQKE